MNLSNQSKSETQCQSKKDYAVYLVEKLHQKVLPIHNIDEKGMCSCGNEKCHSPGKHPIGNLVPNGLTDASDNLETIEKWWSVAPEANIGMTTGNGIDALDVDPDKGGNESLLSIVEASGGLPGTIVVHTGGDGEHYYYRSNKKLRNRTNMLPGIDYRGVGGYVVAPGSNHESGKLYRFSTLHSPSVQGVAELPEYIEKLVLSRKSEKQKTLKDKGDFNEGARNDSLASYAGLLKRAGVTGQDLIDSLKAKNKNSCKPPLSDDEVINIAKSIDRYPSEEEKNKEWEEIIRFGVVNTPKFPIESLPPFYQNLVKEVTGFVQAPLELAAMLLLAVLSRPLLRVVKVRVLKGYDEELAVWVLVALKSGERKSPVMKLIRRPLEVWQFGLIQEWREIVDEIKKEQELLKIEIKAAEHKIKHAKSSDEKSTHIHTFRELKKREREIPSKPQVYFDDATPEEVIGILGRNDEVSIMISDECGAFANMQGRYSKNNYNLDVFLQSHSGSPISKSRSTTESFFLESPCMSMGITLQPKALFPLVKDAYMRGRGFWARSFLILPETLVGKRKANNKSLDENLINEYIERYKKLIKISENDEIINLRLSDEASKSRLDYMDEVETRMREGEDLYEIQDWVNKLVGNVIRIAGILHVASDESLESLEISKETFMKAKEIGDFSIEHAKSILLDSEVNPEYFLAKKILQWLTDNNIKEFSKRDCHYRFKKSVSRVTEIEEPLKILEERNYIRQKSKKGSSYKYEVNPDLLQGEE